MATIPEKHIDELVKRLFDQAVKDGTITDEEYTLIQSIEFEIDDYFKGLEYALEDGVITEEEKQTLNKLTDAVIDKAEYTAAADGIVDDDERELILVLKKVLSIYLS